MDESGTNADFSRLAVAHTTQMDWQASPSSTVWRKRLDLTGPSESSRVTSVVRYDPASAFPEHPHPDGEEIFVLEGVFSDEHGDYPAGSFLLNPEGFSHAPFSQEGCVLFVKLRQYLGKNRQKVAVDTRRSAWQSCDDEGVCMIPLYREEGYPEEIQLVRLEPETVVASHEHEGGAEIFVLEGGFSDEFGSYEEGSWVRYPDGSIHRISTKSGCIYYFKTGHLAGIGD